MYMYTQGNKLDFIDAEIKFMCACTSVGIRICYKKAITCIHIVLTVQLTDMVRPVPPVSLFLIYSENFKYATNSFKKVLIPSSSATTSESSHLTPKRKATGRRTYEQIYCPWKEEQV